jgi:queuine/archaeosine tRNA-ribosyltransferase
LTGEATPPNYDTAKSSDEKPQRGAIVKRRHLQLQLGRSRLRLPQFAPTVFLDQSTWFWQQGLSADVMLVSYDVLARRPSLLQEPLRKTLGYAGRVIVDSGGFGRGSGVTARRLYDVQRRIKADLAVILDEVPLLSMSRREQERVVAVNVRDARSIARGHRSSMQLEGVIHGVTPFQQQNTARALAASGIRVFGVPMSGYSKHRQYAQAVDRFLVARRALPREAVIHALGCGSRTLMGLLTYFGADLFDSSGYFRTASYGKKLSPITMCVLGKPVGKTDCTLCLSKQSVVRTTKDRVRHNLLETLKEAARLRCACEHRVLDEYLRERLKTTALRTLEIRADEVDPQRQVTFYRPRRSRTPK